MLDGCSNDGWMERTNERWMDRMMNRTKQCKDRMMDGRMVII